MNEGTKEGREMKRKRMKIRDTRKKVTVTSENVNENRLESTIILGFSGRANRWAY